MQRLRAFDRYCFHLPETPAIPEHKLPEAIIFDLKKEFDQRTKKEEKAGRTDHKEEKQKEEETKADVINESGDAEISREGDDLGLNEN